MIFLLERPSQPLNFIIIYENTTSLILSWSEPANINGEIDYYIVCVFITLINNHIAQNVGGKKHWLKQNYLSA